MCVCESPSLAGLVKLGTPQGAFRLKLWALAFQIVARGAHGAPNNLEESARRLFSVLTVPVMERSALCFAVLVAEAELDFTREIVVSSLSDRATKRKTRLKKPRR